MAFSVKADDIGCIAVGSGAVLADVQSGRSVIFGSLDGTSILGGSSFGKVGVGFGFSVDGGIEEGLEAEISNFGNVIGAVDGAAEEICACFCFSGLEAVVRWIGLAAFGVNTALGGLIDDSAGERGGDRTESS